ncbi:50S ribosomal protein L29 [Candidatus Woesearchaeota archaeon]|nr:MAG: 50S ribosomal protein L29 [Candidatus Woesearchaeota archaeon]
MKAFTALTKKTNADLDAALAEAQLEIVKLNAQLSTGSAAKEAGKLRALKQKVARIKTIQNQRRNAKV